MAYVKGEFDKAVQYYLEAVNIATDDIDIADYLLRIAQVYYKREQYQNVRKYCKESLVKNPAQGQPHILLGIIYAQAKVSDDPTLQRAVFWAAVDQFIKAKSVEPNENIIEQANKYIRSYSALFPSKEEVFMHPEIEEGKSHYVGGWVSETTTVRSK
jgi:tetratricopeptide (TPR) repeat protein